MSIKAIIFDMDGTIIDTEHIWDKATKQLIVNKGGMDSDDVYAQIRKAIHGLAMPRSVEIVKEIAKLQHSVEELVQEQNRLADELFAQEIRFIDGFHHFHKKTAEKGLKVAIATNAGDNTITLVNKALSLHTFFGEHVYGISAVNYVCKPHPAIYEHAAEKLGVAPHECLAVEDSAHGIRAARAAGMYCIGINTSGKKEDVADSHHAIEKYHEIDLDHLIAQAIEHKNKQK
jgi:beta-phosphoglucomutase